MKKAVFLPMLAIFTIIAVSILGYMFVQNNIKSQNTMVGEKSAQVIKAIITNEKNIGLGKLIENFEKEFNRKISLHILQNIEKSSTEFKNAIANGIVLYGYIKVV